MLRELLERKMQKNPHYSLRAAARDLGVSHTYLSLVLAGKKRLPPKRVVFFSRLLGMETKAAQSFVDAATRDYWEGRLKTVLPPVAGARRKKEREFYVLELDRFKVLSQWYHLALLDLTLVRGFRPDPNWVAKQLNITPRQVRTAVNRLERLGLLEVTAGGWKKTHARLTVPARNPASATRRFHRKMIEKALAALGSTKAESFEARYITGTVMAIDVSRLPEAKKRIARFRKSLMNYLTEGEADELYQLNVQFFPLAKKK